MVKIFTYNLEFIELKNSKISAEIKFFYFGFFVAIEKNSYTAFSSVFYIDNKSF